MFMKKLRLPLRVMILLLFSFTKEGKVCSPIGEKTVCQMCSCPKSDAVAGLGGAACPDGAQPTCKAIEE
jgi:hypothetical protein